MEKGKTSQKTLTICIYCSDQLKEYLEDKNEKKLIEVRTIIAGLLEAWEEIRK